jgi:dihydroorotate dehydrogenase electron transfer subunit
LQGLIAPALKQNAEVVVVCDTRIEGMPEVVEVQPLKALEDALQWADYAALDAGREKLNQLRERLGGMSPFASKGEAQVLIRSPMPCGALADCGVCALTVRHDWKMICRDGPVFDWKEM